MRDWAIQLELTSIEVHDDSIEGRLRNVLVTLKRDDDTIHLRLAFTRLAPFEELKRHDGSLLLDDVESGDAHFDRTVRVTATNWNRHPTRELLQSEPMRTAATHWTALDGTCTRAEAKLTLTAPSLSDLKHALSCGAALVEAHASTTALRAEPPDEPVHTYAPHKWVGAFFRASYIEEYAPDRFHAHRPGDGAACVNIDANLRVIKAGSITAGFHQVTTVRVYPESLIGPHVLAFEVGDQLVRVAVGSRNELWAFAVHLEGRGLVPPIHEEPPRRDW